MNIKSADIEVFTSSFCNRCKDASLLVAQLLKEEGFESVTWREIDVVEEIDYSVTLAVLTTPTIAIGGKRVFSSLPSRQQLRQAIQQYLIAGKSNDD